MTESSIHGPFGWDTTAPLRRRFRWAKWSLFRVLSMVGLESVFTYPLGLFTEYQSRWLRLQCIRLRRHTFVKTPPREARSQDSAGIGDTRLFGEIWELFRMGGQLGAWNTYRSYRGVWRLPWWFELVTYGNLTTLLDIFFGHVLSEEHHARTIIPSPLSVSAILFVCLQTYQFCTAPMSLLLWLQISLLPKGQQRQCREENISYPTILHPLFERQLELPQVPIFK